MDFIIIIVFILYCQTCDQVGQGTVQFESIPEVLLDGAEQKRVSTVMSGVEFESFSSPSI